MRIKIYFFLLIIPVLTYPYLLFTRKLTQDSTLQRFRKSLLSENSFSTSIIRKDKEKNIYIFIDKNWSRLFLNVSPALFNGKLIIYDEHPLRGPNGFNWAKGVAIDTSGNFFFSNTVWKEILKYKYDWRGDSLIYIEKFSYNIFPIGIAVMANDSLCPERSFWVCDSVNNRIVKFGYPFSFFF
ncbi:MAG: hypothetical protein NZ891_02510 [bacterium]|nr:hypothetical protein [bacterium]MDW8163596.1 hypothetical protein [Candidatus Omnitrophota bacterium]